MPGSSQRIVFDSLTKRYGDVVALDGLTAEVASGAITAVLGTNGAGKSTALKALLGLVEPTSGTTLIGGKRYRDLDEPIRRVGAVLEGTIFHPGRSGRDHLLAMARVASVGPERVDELLEEVGLTQQAGQRVGGYSLGMRQRLSIAAGLLGDPEVLVLDEPGTGLDVRGITWLRSLLLGLRERGRTTLLSSHALSEVEQLADDVLVLHEGRAVAHSSLSGLMSDRPGATLEEVFFGLIEGGAVAGR